MSSSSLVGVLVCVCLCLCVANILFVHTHSHSLLSLLLSLVNMFFQQIKTCFLCLLARWLGLIASTGRVSLCFQGSQKFSTYIYLLAVHSTSQTLWLPSCLLHAPFAKFTVTSHIIKSNYRFHSITRFLRRSPSRIIHA